MVSTDGSSFEERVKAELTIAARPVSLCRSSFFSQPDFSQPELGAADWLAVPAFIPSLLEEGSSEERSAEVQPQQSPEGDHGFLVRGAEKPAVQLRVLEGVTLPAALKELPEPPARLFVRGELPRMPCVAVVGARDATADALIFAQKFAFELARQGVAVASGGAEGIDAAAHRGALDAGGVTLVVAPSGFDHPYPKEHGPLFAEVVERGGCHLSPFATHVCTRCSQFFLRNAVLVALSHALVIVEAGVPSGTSNAARWARRLGRPCFAVPSAPWNRQGLGGLRLLEAGLARPLFTIGPLLRLLGERGLHAIALPEGQPPLVEPAANEPKAARSRGTQTKQKLPRTAPAGSATELAILEAIESGVCFPTELEQALSLGAGEVSHTVLLLTLRGLVENRAGMLVRVQR
jgi:DNA processing protein